VNRLVIVAVAAVVAIASGVGLVLYVSGAEDRAVESAAPVAVLVAASDIAPGTAFESALRSGAIVEAQTPVAMRPETAVTDTSELAGKVSENGMLAGQTVVDGEFVEPGEQRRTGPPTFADQLDNGTVAVSFDAVGADAVAELVQPGDRVNLLVQVPNASEVGLADSGGPAVVHVFQDLEILAVGTSTTPAEPAEEEAEEAELTTGSYTVAVAPKDAPRVLLLTREYPTYIALAARGTEPDQIPPVDRNQAIPDTLTAEEAVPGLEP
jgi:pilus assembly protein CpaB